MFELNYNHEEISARREKIEQEIMEFKKQVAEKFSENDQADIFEALEFMLKIHLPQKDRVDGRPFASHPLAVAIEVMKLSNNPKLVIAALDHDSVEDQPDHIFVERINRKYFNNNSLSIEINEDTKERYHDIFKDWSFKEIKDLFGDKVEYYIRNLTNHDFDSLADSLNLTGEAKESFINKLYAEHVEDIMGDPDLFTLKLADLSTNIDLRTLDQNGVKYQKLKRKYKSVIESIINKLENMPIDHPIYNKREQVINDLSKVYSDYYSN